MKTLDIELPVAELKEVLPGLGKVISRKTSLPVLGFIRVMVDQTGAVKLQATDLDDFATITLAEKRSGPAGEMLVPFEDLNKIVKGCPSDQLVRLVGSKSSTVLRYERQERLQLKSCAKSVIGMVWHCVKKFLPFL